MMLPAVPKTLGRLSDVFTSSLGAITGADNRLGLKRAERVVAILVDGLGSYNIKAAGGHAHFLNRAVIDAHPLNAGFPSTTATSITSFATGLTAGEHGIVGYRVLDPDTKQPLNQLTGWSSQFDPLIWQPNQTITEKAVEAGIGAFVVGPAEYAKTGFTTLTMRGATYVPAKTIEDRLSAALDILASPSSSLTYVYVPELDQKAHAFGVNSREWLAQIEELDSAVAKFSAALSSRKFEKAAAVLTADHGIVDVPTDNHIHLDEFDLPPLALVAGDPRVNYLYLTEKLEENALRKVVESLQNQFNERPFGHAVAVATKSQLIAAKWFGQNVTEVAAARMPDIFAVAINRTAIYHRDFAAPKSLKMIGQHGSVTPEELAIPFVKFGAFAR